MRFFCIYGLWGLFVIVWFVSAFFRRKTVKRESRSSRIGYALIAASGGVVLQPSILRFPALDIRWTQGDAWGVVAAALTALGIW